jgi:hypothetical protein
VTFERVIREGEKGTDEVASRASLVGRVRSQIKKRGGCECGWQRAQQDFSAWWRIWVDPDGEVHTLLGMRWELCGQVGIALPGVGDQPSLGTLGRRYGLFLPAGAVTDVTGGGKERLSVLSHVTKDELFQEPDDDDLPPQPPVL